MGIGTADDPLEHGDARACALYESEGWIADGEISTEEMLGVTVTEVRDRRLLRP